MTRIFRPVPLALAMAAAFPLAVNADSAARVEFTAGEVRAVAADGRSRPLTRGAQVGSGDTIDTGSGRAQMRFTDGALVSLQPQTQFRIDQYAFAGKPDEDRGFFNLLKGGLRTITGLVGKANRSNYKLTTSVATIGIRGTEFSVAYGNSINVTTGDGAVDVCNGAGCLTVEDGQSAYVADQNTIPVIIEVKTDLPPPPPSNASGGVEPPVSNEVFLVGEERDDDGDLVTLDGLDPQGDLQSGDGYYVYGQYTEQYGGYGGLVTLTGVNTVIEGSALKSADNGDSGVLTAGTVVQSAQDGIIGWGRWASASCTGFSCDGDDIVDLHYVTGRATPDLAALGGISATYSLSGATTPTASGGAPGGAVSGTLLADFTNYTADLDLGVTVSAVTFNVSGSGSINSGTAAFAGSFDSCSGCGSTPNGSFHGFFAGPAAERAGVVYSFDSAINGIDKVTGAAVFARGGSNQGN